MRPLWRFMMNVWYLRICCMDLWGLLGDEHVHFRGLAFFGEVYGDLCWFHEFKKDLADVRMASSSIKRVSKKGDEWTENPRSLLNGLVERKICMNSLKSPPLEVSCIFSLHRWLATAEKHRKTVSPGILKTSRQVPSWFSSLSGSHFGAVLVIHWIYIVFYGPHTPTSGGFL